MRKNKHILYTPSLLDKLKNVELSILKDFIKTSEKHNLQWFVAYGTALGAVRHNGFIPWDDDIDVFMLRKDYDKFMKIFDKELGKKYNLVTPERTPGYSASVTHLELKGTKFVHSVSEIMPYKNGICIDIFMLDKTSANKIRQWFHLKKCWIYGRLLFLCENPKPNIPLNGIMKNIAKIICSLIHKILKLFRISSKTMYKKLDKCARKYNNSKSNLYTSLTDYLMKESLVYKDDIFPLKKVKYEDIQVNIMNNHDKNLTNLYGDYMKMPPAEKRYNHRPAIIEFNET